jgi:hypothetical protein
MQLPRRSKPVDNWLPLFTFVRVETLHKRGNARGNADPEEGKKI